MVGEPCALPPKISAHSDSSFKKHRLRFKQISASSAVVKKWRERFNYYQDNVDHGIFNEVKMKCELYPSLLKGGSKKSNCAILQHGHLAKRSLVCYKVFL